MVNYIFFSHKPCLMPQLYWREGTIEEHQHQGWNHEDGARVCVLC